ncbi:L-arabinose transport system permease protein AraQ [bioreactor metagenome]|uniref:L-arabinose transport system permease protein AraQ n=1 Tax=bioreactor metagenome TaxID=1076179 RepID=A0A644YIT5_9ZZZZ|nr:carbohydrate ABC transporter permease [Erysipelotrichaceae bacterium]
MNKNIVRIFFTYLILSLGAALMIFPFFWMFSSALKTPAESASFPPVWFPAVWQFGNFTKALGYAPFGRYFLNSLLVTGSSVIVTGTTTILASFAFSRLQWKGRDLVFSLLLALMMVPFEMLIITNYQTISKLGLNDTLLALIIPFTSSIFYTYILRNFFLSIPDALYYSARIDGASNWQYLWKIMVPIAKPSIVTIVLLNAIASWNSFMWPLLIINSKFNRTLPLGLYAFVTEAGTHFELLMAASTLIVLPVIFVFIFARKHIINGVARGGLKG